MAGTTTSDSAELTTELRSPIVKVRPTDDYLTITGGTQGIYVNTGAVYMGGALVADPGLVTTSSCTQGVQHQIISELVQGESNYVVTTDDFEASRGPSASDGSLSTPPFPLWRPLVK